MNCIIFAADCLDILNDGAALLDASVGLIYLDPLFNPNSNKPVESFVDIWKWSDQDAETLDYLGRDPGPLTTNIKFARDIKQMSGAESKGRRD